MEKFTKRISVPNNKVLKRKNTFCVEKRTVNIDKVWPEKINIKFLWSPGLEEYINYNLYKVSKKNDSALYRSTIFGQKLLIYTILDTHEGEQYANI